MSGLLIGRRKKKVKFCGISRDKFMEKTADCMEIFGANFTEKRSVKIGQFCGNFLGKFHWKAKNKNAAILPFCFGKINDEKW